MSVKRKSIGKKVRFEVFKRDQFKCQYCGSSPPSVTLEIDHISPISKGGSNDIDNLVTACFDCNRGKSNNLLSSVPESLIQKSEREQELEEQLKGIKKIRTARKRRVTRDVNALERVFQEYFEDNSFSNSFKQSVQSNFLTKLVVDDLLDNMHKACSHINDAESALKYFCGINWNVIKEGGRYEY